MALLAHDLGELGGISRGVLAVPQLTRGIEGIADVVLTSGVEDGGHDLDAACLGSVAQVTLHIAETEYLCVLFLITFIFVLRSARLALKYHFPFPIA